MHTHAGWKQALFKCAVDKTIKCVEHAEQRYAAQPQSAAQSQSAIAHEEVGPSASFIRSGQTTANGLEIASRLTSLEELVSSSKDQIEKMANA